MELHELVGKTSADLLSFVLGGKAIFTVQNEETGNRFTFKVVKPKNATTPIFFAKTLTGPDNYTHYTYMGLVVDGGRLIPTKGSKIGTDAKSFQVLSWLLSVLSSKRELPAKVHFYHAGTCCRCGRRLTTPESVQNGIGPECAKKV